MNISVKKFSKKSLSFLIALIMVFSALPLTPPISADAATMSETLLNDRHGLVTNGSDSRMKNSNKQYQIVNDQKENNTNAGVLHFDLSKYSNKKIESVQFNAKLDSSTGDSQISNMNFYYSTTLNGKDSTYLTSGGKETLNTKIGYGSGTTANEKYLNHLIGHYDENSDRLFQIDYKEQNPTSQKNKDVTEEIKQIILSGKTDLYIIVMHSNAGGANSTNGWSDALISPANINFTVTYSNYDFSNPTQAKEYIDERINVLSRTYTNVYTSNADSTFMNGVIAGTGWSDPTEITINDYDSDTGNYINLKIHGLSNSVAIYTGNSSDIRFPVIFENSGYGNKDGDTVTYMSIDHVSLSSGNFALSGNNWDRCSEWNDLTSNSETTFNFYSTSDGNFNREAANSTNKFETKYRKTWRNYIKYTGSGDTNNYYEKLTSAEFNFQADLALNWKTGWFSWDGWGTGKQGANYNRDLTYPLGLYVLNYKPLNDIIVSADFKNNYNNISQNSWKYTQEDLANYYAVVADILAFNLTNESMTNETEISAVANKIKNLVTRYNDYKSPHRKSLTITFNRNDNSTEIKNILAGDSIGTLPNNSSAIHIEGTDTHNGYIWSGVTSSTVPQSNTTYTEVPAVLNCSGGTATCTQKAICSSCNTEYGSLAKHSFETDWITGLVNKEKAPEGDNNGYTYQGCANCDAEDPSRVNYRVYNKTDWSAYNAEEIVAQEEIQNTAKYTAESIKKVTDIIQEVTPNDERKSQKYINDMTTALTEAVETLVLNKYSITVKYVDENGNDLAVGEKGATYKTYDAVDYGTIQNIVAPTSYDGKKYIVYKWTRDIQGNNTISGLNSSSLDVVVKGASTYYVFLKNTSVDESQASGKAVITLNNKSNKVYDIGYVAISDSVPVIVDVDNGTITIDGKKLTAPNYSFYNITGFNINGKIITGTDTVSITKDTVIRPVYEAKQTVRITRASADILINGKNDNTVDVEWNKKIVVSTNDSSSVVWKTGFDYNGDGTIDDSEKNVVAYGPTYSFYANSNVTIFADAIAEPTAPTASIGLFSYDPTDNKVTVVNNFFVPEGKKAVKAGVILSTKSTLANMTNEERVKFLKAQTNGKFEGTEEKFSGTDTNKNQIRISVTRTATTSFTMYALAYVVTDDGQTYYAPTVRSITYTATKA